MVVNRCALVSVFGVSLLSATSSGQTLTARSSVLNLNYVYGAGGDTHTGSDLLSDNAMIAADAEQGGFTGSTSGVLPGNQPYDAGVLASLGHSYTIGGTLPQFETIAATASSRVQAAASGLGSALMNSNNPGNELAFYFTLDALTPYRLDGAVSTPRPGAFTAVSLQRFDGLVWQYIFYSAFLPGQQGEFDVAGTLSSGNYRLTNVIALNSFGNEDLTASSSFRLTIPSPGVAGLLGLGWLMAARRRRS